MNRNLLRARVVRRSWALLIAATWPVLHTHAQPPVADSLHTASMPACLRFQFGPWSPPLDWRDAGHPSSPDSVRVERASGGQSWATGMPSGQQIAASDTLLFLYPPFWPAGVSIVLDRRAFVGRDTIFAKATAFVADGNRPSPSSRATLWRVPCH
jgi:hypothetical protein